MAQGTVKWFNTQGYGFINPDEDGNDSSFTLPRFRIPAHRPNEGQRFLSWPSSETRFAAVDLSIVD